MPSLGNTPRPAYVYDTETDTWVPIGVGAHTHDYIPNTLVDAKGDILTATADNVPARLAKGADGTVLVSDSTTSTGLAWQPYGAQYYAGKNFVINGAFDIYQRSSNPTVGNTISGGNNYSADRWNVWNTSPSGSIVLSRQLSGLTGIQYCARFQRPAGNTAGLNFFGQPIETANSILLAGKTVTLSFYARKGADYSDTASALQAQVWQNTTTDVGLPTIEGGSRSTAAATTATLTTSWQRFTCTGTISSASTQLAVVFYGSTTGTAAANDYYEITGVQLEVGSIATHFSRSAGTIQGELAACQRYYFRQTSNSTNGAAVPIAIGIAGSSTILYPIMHYPVTMRREPTSVDFANVNIWQGAGLTAITNITLQSNSVGNDKTLLNCTTSGLTTGQTYGVLTNASGLSGFIGLNAEL